MVVMPTSVVPKGGASAGEQGAGVPQKQQEVMP
jgi:hypothetical protein